MGDWGNVKSTRELEHEGQKWLIERKGSFIQRRNGFHIFPTETSVVVVWPPSLSRFSVRKKLMERKSDFVQRSKVSTFSPQRLLQF